MNVLRSKHVDYSIVIECRGVKYMLNTQLNTMKNILLLMLVLAMLLPSCSKDAHSCKYKVAQKKKEIRAKQRIEVKPYYVRLQAKVRR